MPVIPWRCAHGDAPWQRAEAGTVVDLSGLDTNRVIVTGCGVIDSLGPSPRHDDVGVPCTKTVFFEPLGGPIILRPGPNIALLGDGERRVTGRSFAVFSCDGLDHWTENSFTDLAWSPEDMNELIAIVDELAAGRPHLRDRILAMRIRRLGLLPVESDERWA